MYTKVSIKKPNAKVPPPTTPRGGRREVVVNRSHLRRLALGRLLKEAGFGSAYGLDPLSVGYENFREGGVHLGRVVLMMTAQEVE